MVAASGAGLFAVFGWGADGLYELATYRVNRPSGLLTWVGDSLGKWLFPMETGDGCFVAGTLVAMADGTFKPIEMVQPGDFVCSRNPATGATEVKRVSDVSRHTVHDLVRGEFADAATGKVVETIVGTVEHPFFVLGGGTVGLGKLGIGTSVLVRAGPALVVKSITRESHPEGVSVYNFEVEGDHTYFVGKANGGAWVHNAGGCGDTFDEAKTISAHTLGGSEAQRLLRRGEGIHVFDEGVDLNALAQKVRQEGQFAGNVRGHDRFIWQSPTPIGTRIQSGKPTIPLNWVEIKVNPQGKYHLVPRTRPAK